ncbi:MAG TPA: IMP cyclohydrolase [Candidatus Brocadiia bacterium]|nr:IMP cyclohydrolase [Candidatus Brocadiia bacterium]
MKIRDAAGQNMKNLRANVYPGRGIVIGMTPDARNLVQVYWIMGRSENSRNRVFIAEGDVVRTAPFDASKVKDPSLIIYNCARVLDRTFIVSNGDQTDTIHDSLKSGGSFEKALYGRTFEPDAPNFTPRISAVVAPGCGAHQYQIGILKTMDNNPELPARQIYSYGRGIPGIGHFIATYSGDGAPLPSFEGEPQPVEIPNDIDATLNLYWTALNDDNKVSLMVRFINAETCAFQTRIVNKLSR